LLDGLDLAAAHRHRQSATLADFHCGIAGAAFAGKREHALRQFPQLVLGVGKNGVVHVCFM